MNRDNHCRIYIKSMGPHGPTKNALCSPNKTFVSGGLFEQFKNYRHVNVSGTHEALVKLNDPRNAKFQILIFCENC